MRQVVILILVGLIVVAVSATASALWVHWMTDHHQSAKAAVEEKAEVAPPPAKAPSFGIVVGRMPQRSVVVTETAEIGESEPVETAEAAAIEMPEDAQDTAVAERPAEPQEGVAPDATAQTETMPVTEPAVAADPTPANSPATVDLDDP